MKKVEPIPLSVLVRSPEDHSARSLLDTLLFRDQPYLAYTKREKVYYLTYPLSQYDITLRKARSLLHTFEQIGAIIFATGFFLLYLVSLVENFPDFISLRSLLNTMGSQPLQSRLYIVFSVINLLYLYYIRHAFTKKHTVVEQRSFQNVALDTYDVQQHQLQNFESLKLFRSSHRVNITSACTPEFLKALDSAHQHAKKMNSTEILPAHLLLGLLDGQPVQSVFLRLGIPIQIFRSRLNQILEGNSHGNAPAISESAAQAIMNSYERAYEIGQSYVHVTELLINTVRASEPLQSIFFDVGIDLQKLTQASEWVRLREQMRRDYHHFRKAAAKVSKHGMDRAMTAVATPFLNQFSRDLTLVAKYGGMVRAVGRDEEIEQILRVVDAGRQHVVITGEHGVGKRSIIQGIVIRMIEGTVPDRLKDKRLVEISTSALLAGTTLAGAQQRLIKIMNEINRAKNIIVFINNVHDLVSISPGTGQEGLDISETLAEYMRGAHTVLFATATTQGYTQQITHSQIATSLTRIQIPEMTADQAIQVLETKVGKIEFDQHVFFSYEALEHAAVMAGKYMYDQPLPGSALEVVTEAASVARANNGKNTMVKGEHVAQVISQKTGIPVANITEDESEKLLKLEDELHKRIIGQEDAVVIVANALRRARANIREGNRPIANFLFLGPTGVGKTELAKTIANVYFGGEDKMIRLDMSEYQDSQSIDRLIGMPGRQGTGVFTEAVRQKPFSLVLLDELEKASPDVMNVFLQVFDDGRLTDSVGRTVDFTNTIIIATSNAGTEYVSKRLAEQVPLETVRQELMHETLRKTYKTEFLNRFDGIVLFRALTKEEIIQIAAIMLKRVANNLDERGITFVATNDALATLADVGFDPEFGARPMRRAVQDKVENALAEKLLSGKVTRGATITLDKNLILTIS